MTNKNKNSILFQPRSGSICSSSLVFMLIIVLNTIINDKKHHYNISLEKHCNTTYCTLMIPITTTMLIIFTEYYSSYFERKVCLRWFEVPPSPSSLISGCGDPDSCKGKASKTLIRDYVLTRGGVGGSDMGDGIMFKSIYVERWNLLVRCLNSRLGLHSLEQILHCILRNIRIEMFLLMLSFFSTWYFLWATM